MLPCELLGTACLLSDPRVLTSDLLREANLEGRDPAKIEAKLGIESRSWFPSEVPSAQLGARVLREALERASLLPQDIKRLIFVSSTGGDFLLPATANAVLEAAGIEDTCDALDLNNACMGFLTAMDIAARNIVTGLGPIAIVVVEKPSRFLNRNDYRSYIVFGDAAVAVILGQSKSEGGIRASFLRNYGKYRDSVTLAQSGLTGQQEYVRFNWTNATIQFKSIQSLKLAVDRVMSETDEQLANVDWVVPHQPNGILLRRIMESLGCGYEKIMESVSHAGNVGAASIPLGLHSLFVSGKLKPKDKILMTGVGGGMSYGAMLYQCGSLTGGLYEDR